jgi:hypothetical protein
MDRSVRNRIPKIGRDATKISNRREKTEDTSGERWYS